MLLGLHGGSIVSEGPLQLEVAKCDLCDLPNDC